MKSKLTRLVLAAVVLALSVQVPALAQQTDDASASGLMPPVSGDAVMDAEIPAEINATHPPLRITPDKAEILRLDTNVATVVVGNPAHAALMVENPRLLVIVPKLPGVTYMTVMDASNKVIMQRHLIVASPKEKYVRLRRNCNQPAMSGESGYELGECQWMRVYHCPDNSICNEIVFEGDVVKGGDGTEDAVEDLAKGGGEDGDQNKSGEEE